MSEFYVTPYREALQWAGQNLSDEVFKTFVMLMSHANDLGVCFPGYRRLVELTLHEVQRVSDEMQALITIDVVRQLEAAKQDKFGRWTPALYQISPRVLRLRDKFMTEAIALWNSVLILEQKVPVQSLTSIVSIESELNQNQNQNQESESENSSSKQIFPVLESEIPNAGQIAAWQFRYPKPEKMQVPIQQREAQSGSAAHIDNAPPVPTPPHEPYEKLPEIAEKLPTDIDETLAERIRTDTKIPIKLARAIVDKFGHERTRNALRSDFVKTARKPGGALRHLLEKQNVETDELKKLSSSRISSDYEDFVIS